MKITENLKSVMKALENREKVEVITLSQELGRTTNSIRSTLSVPDYKKYFTNEDIFNETTKKVVKYYSLSEEGIKLIQNNFNTENGV